MEFDGGGAGEAFFAEAVYGSNGDGVGPFFEWPGELGPLEVGVVGLTAKFVPGGVVEVVFKGGEVWGHCFGND